MRAPKTQRRPLERQLELDRKGHSPAQERNYERSRVRWGHYQVLGNLAMIDKLVQVFALRYGNGPAIDMLIDGVDELRKRVKEELEKLDQKK